MDTRPGLCIFLCLSLAGCASGGSPGECQVDEDCNPGLYCRSGECVFDCSRDGDCPEGFTCSVRGKCERGCKISNGGVETCDGADNDCDGETDEGLLNRCGECEPPDEDLHELCQDDVDNDCDGQTDEGFDRLGTPCENQGCQGEWACSADGRSEVCPVGPPEESDARCDGLDEDCDGQTDEDVLPAPCELQEGVCAGTTRTCLGAGVWSECEYGPDYTAEADSRCDFLDNDCDGETDEEAEPILEGELGAEASDGLDNNCNGIVDEPGGAMLRIPINEPTWIDAFETAVFDGPGCTGARYGIGADDYPPGWPPVGTPTVTLFACSLPGVLPSGHLSWHRARWACEAQGKRLCTVDEWVNACTAGTGRQFPYGSNFTPGICNDAWQGIVGDPPDLAETGAFEDCASIVGVRDMSGNLAEWLADWSPDRADFAITTGGSYVCENCEWGICMPCDPGDPWHPFEIEHYSDCRAEGQSYECFRRDDPKAYLSTRCCLNGP